MKKDKKDGPKSIGGFEKIPGVTGLYQRTDSSGTTTYYMTWKKSGYLRVGLSTDLSLKALSAIRERYIIKERQKVEETMEAPDRFGYWFEQYLRHKKLSSISTAHCDEVVYRLYLEKVFIYAPLKNITRSRIEAFLGGLINTPPKTKRRILAAIHRAYTYIIDLGYNIGDPTKGIRIKVQPFRKTRILTRREIDRMIRWCDEMISRKELTRPDFIELKAQITMGVEMGLRRSELFTDPAAVEKFGTDRSLRWADIDLNERKVRLTRKGNSIHTMTMTPNVWAALCDLKYRDLGTEGRVFRAFQLRLFNIMLGDLDLNFGLNFHVPKDRERWISFHILRHTFGSIILDQTKDLMVVSKLMNHSYQQTTLLYAHLLDNKEDEAMDLVGKFFS